MRARRKRKRYILLLKNQTDKTLNKIENEFSLSVASSEDLSSTNRSFDIIDGKNAMLYKNLNVVVADDVDEEHLTKVVAQKTHPILYFEEEKEFTIAQNELELIGDLKENISDLQKKLLELEKLIQDRNRIPDLIVNYEWGLEAIGLQNTKFTGKGIDICILDTGFQIDHPDFQNRIIEGKSFVAGEPWDQDSHGHGTHCAGVAAGFLQSETMNRYGIAKDADIKIAKVLANNGIGSTSSIIDAIDWAITKEFRIISMSLASPVNLNESPSPLFETVGQKALDNNCLIIAAAGNDSKRPSMPKPVSAPANAQSIMAVAAIDSNMKIASFSNGGLNPTTGGAVDICAPGVNIFSSYVKNSKSNEFYKKMNGTSMATPHVSGLAALYMEQFPKKSAKEIWRLLEENALKIDGLDYRDIGNGLVQAIKS